MRDNRVRGAGVFATTLVAALVGASATPAAAVTPPRIDPGALVRSAPVAPLEPTEQRHLCNIPELTRTVTKPTAAQAMMNLPEAWRFSRGQGQRVAVIDTASREVMNRIDVGPNPIQMVATPDGAYVYVANQGTDAEPNNTVSVIDTATGQVVKTLATGGGAHGVSVSTDGAFVFVTNIADDSVSVIDVARQEVVGSVPVGDRPNGVVYGPSN